MRREEKGQEWESEKISRAGQSGGEEGGKGVEGKKAQREGRKWKWAGKEERRRKR